MLYVLSLINSSIPLLIVLDSVSLDVIGFRELMKELSLAYKIKLGLKLCY